MPAGAGARIGLRIGSWVVIALTTLVIFQKASAPWVENYLHDPLSPLSVNAAFRPDGDLQYYPLIYGLSRLTLKDNLVTQPDEKATQAFPVAGMLVHALGYRAFGAWGYAAADLLIACLFYFCLVWLFRTLFFGETFAKCAALITFAGLAEWALDRLSRPIFAPLLARAGAGGSPFNPFIWGQRLPRPYVTAPFLVACLALLVTLWADEEQRERYLGWGLLALALSCLVQSDLYSGVTMCLVTACSGAVFLARSAAPRALVYRLVFFLILAFLLCMPFIFQQLTVKPDIARRLGVFAVSRSHPYFLSNKLDIRVLRLALQWSLFGALVYLSRKFPTRAPGERLLRGWFLLLLVLTVSWFTLPVLCVATGKVAQPCQLIDRNQTLAIYGSVLLAAFFTELLLDLLGRKLPSRWRPIFRGNNACVFACLACLLFLWNHRPRVEDFNSKANLFPGYRSLGRNYRPDFAALVSNIERTTAAGAMESLATFDHQLYAWWSAFGPHRMFLADPFATTLSDDAQERRLIYLCKILGMDGPRFIEWLKQYYIDVVWLAHNKYQFSKAHTFSELSDYTEEERRSFPRLTEFSTWSIALPQSELKRLQTKYESLSLEKSDVPWPEVVVLTAYELRQGLRPCSPYREVYRNTTFRMWRR